ncbi:MAG: protoheme IX farnesyltransferase [Chloroflexi bacterium]|nr:protoheme IX farnesyltransferase [Chloroflexota bacterium]
MTEASVARTQPSWAQTVSTYIRLTKPRIMLLLLITTAGAMLLAANGLPPFYLLAVTLIGGALGAGGASAINNYMDRDIDQLMQRTASRPVASGDISPRKALSFGVTLLVGSFLLLAVVVNVLAAVLTMIGALFYIFVYTGWLKRSSVHGVVIGGAAGALPPLVGWAAVTGELSLLAYLLFATIFIWTPPHFWALSLLIKNEYERAQVPMLPVIRGETETRRQIVWYSIGLVGFTLLVAPLGSFGVLYALAAGALGASFLYRAARLLRSGTRHDAGNLFHYSILYLALLFAAMVLDRQLPALITTVTRIVTH